MELSANFIQPRKVFLGISATIREIILNFLKIWFSTATPQPLVTFTEKLKEFLRLSQDFHQMFSSCYFQLISHRAYRSCSTKDYSRAFEKKKSFRPPYNNSYADSFIDSSYFHKDYFKNSSTITLGICSEKSFRHYLMKSIMKFSKNSSINSTRYSSLGLSRIFSRHLSTDPQKKNPDSIYEGI